MTSIMKRSISLFLLITLVLSAMLATPRTSLAATIGVNTYEDQGGEDMGHCSLREAIISVNSGTGYGGCANPNWSNDQIALQAGTYPLTKTGTGDDTGYTGDLDILRAVHISGAGPGITIIAAQPGLQDRVFHIKSATNVTISNLTISGGNASSDPLKKVGGGIFNDQGAQLLLFKVTLTENSVMATNGAGGGLANWRGKVFINSSTFVANSAISGGAIYNEGILDIRGSLFYSNTGTSLGGGIDHRPLDTNRDVMTISNSTLAGNTSPQGAALATAGKATLKNLTVANNTGSALHLSGPADLVIQNTLVVRNSAVNCSYFGGTPKVTTLGYNLESGNTCRLTNPTDQINKSSVILADNLADNEGPTGTYALINNGANPAIDIIPSLLCPGIDQRALGRVGERCDIGAYEDGGLPLMFFTYLPNTNR